MEALALEKSVSLGKQIKYNPKKKTQNYNHRHHHHHHHPHHQVTNMISRQASAIDQNFIQQPTEMDMMMMMTMMHGHGHGHGGVFLNPHAYVHPHSYHFSRSSSLQPPLLPFPATAKPAFTKKPMAKNPNFKGHVSSSRTNKAGRSPPCSENYVVDPLNKRVGPSSESIFSLSPPPSSLPFPRFSLRQPKRSCTVEAATTEIDDGATTTADRLCQMLSLR